MKFTYRIEVMHCAACIEKVKSALLPLFKVTEITLNPRVLQIDADKPPLLSDLNTHISSAGKYSLQLAVNTENMPLNTSDINQTGLSAYYPIFLIAAYIVGVASINNFHWQEINWQGWMYQFMAGFFLVFSAFKLLDIHG